MALIAEREYNVLQISFIIRLRADACHEITTPEFFLYFTHTTFQVNSENLFRYIRGSHEPNISSIADNILFQQVFCLNTYLVTH